MLHYIKILSQEQLNFNQAFNNKKLHILLYIGEEISKVLIKKSVTAFLTFIAATLLYLSLFLLLVMMCS